MRKHFVLTAISLKTLKPGRHADGGNLYIDVKPNGQRYWAFRYKMPGQKLREMGLGSAGEGNGAVSLKEARDRAAELRRLIRAGIDPLERRSEAVAKRKADIRAAEIAAVTFEQVAQQYLELHSPMWENEKHRNQWYSTLKAYVYPKLGSLPVASISRVDVLGVIEPIWLTKTETANRVRNRIELILDFAKVRDLRTGDNPASWRGNLSAALPAPGKVREVRHHPAMDWKALPEFYSLLSGHTAIGSLALRFLILTGMRTGSVLKACWDQIDFEKSEWAVPYKNMKTRNDFIVPLPPEALRVLAEAYELHTQSDGLIFSVTGNPLSNMTMSAVLHRMNVSNATVHGFRSSFRDWASDSVGYPKEVAEAAIAHKVLGKVEAAYRRGNFLDTRKKLMADWAEYCTSKCIQRRPQLRLV